jgi:predicted RNA binding protein YcfA (HicA-like mRNA interferase family)
MEWGNIYGKGMKTKDVIKLLKRNGWEELSGRGKGGHVLFKKPGEPRPIPIPTGGHHKEMATGTLRSVLKAAGLEHEMPGRSPKAGVTASPGPTPGL